MKTVRMGLLFDFYGQLLTERQQQFFAHYFEDDLSLGEIAEQYDVSRQAVYDMLRRSSKLLEGYESRLKLVEKFRDEEKYLNESRRLLRRAMELLSNTSPDRRPNVTRSDGHRLTETHRVQSKLEKAMQTLERLHQSRFE